MTTFTIITTILLSIIAGILYRMGGSGHYARQWRLFGVPTIATITFILIFGFNIWWSYVLAFGLLYASILTYWDWLFGYDCFWFSGLFVGLAGLPVSLAQGKWVGSLIRMGVIAIVWQLLNKLLPQKVFIWTRDIVEEFGRGLITVLTIPLLIL